MTKEEAISNIKMISVAFVDPVTNEQRKLIDDTFEMAIKALEQEPQSDIEAIRQEIEALKNQPPQYDDMFEYISGIDDALYIIVEHIQKPQDIPVIDYPQVEGITPTVVTKEYTLCDKEQE